MVYPGHPSRGCFACRRKKVKVCTLLTQKREVLVGICALMDRSVMRPNRNAADAPGLGRSARDTDRRANYRFDSSRFMNRMTTRPMQALDQVLIASSVSTVGRHEF